jgi:hypothetical protein
MEAAKTLNYGIDKKMSRSSSIRMDCFNGDIGNRKADSSNDSESNENIFRKFVYPEEFQTTIYPSMAPQLLFTPVYPDLAENKLPIGIFILRDSVSRLGTSDWYQDNMPSSKLSRLTFTSRTAIDINNFERDSSDNSIAYIGNRN